MALFTSLDGYRRDWMLGLLAADLQRQGVQLLFARDVGQVRDVLAREEGERPLLRTYPTVRARSTPSGSSRVTRRTRSPSRP